MHKLSIGSAQRPARGERVCGDGFVVIDQPDATVIGVADGLGHGPLAAKASNAFCEYLRAHPDLEPEAALLGAHDAIRETRGVAGVVLRINKHTDRLDFAGVGNIEVRTISAEPIKPVSVPGVVGGRLHKVRPFDYHLTPGDLLVVFSDGITGSLAPRDFDHLEPTEMAETIMGERGKDYDDVTCLVIRFN